VDKLGRDYRGDPAAALLEILDPAQNNTFRDNYLDLPFDLSRVFFICTANTLETIPGPLLDRLEILRLSGYSEEEKVEIAKRYLIRRQWAENGVKPDQLILPDNALRLVVSRYTREAGVRQLEQTLGRLVRQVAIRFAEGNTDPVTIKPEDLLTMLGPERFSLEKARRELPPGVATGLAWTEAGGDVLYIEATLLPYAKKLRLTGQLGKVMRESAKAAHSLIWSKAKQLGIDSKLFQKSGVHVHVPAGAVPKDGPSAGIAMVTALASLYTGIPARADTAMTGEITLTGLVLPIGGVKEKVLAARRAGIKRVILPKANEKDLGDLPENVRKELEFILAESVDQVLPASLTKVPTGTKLG
jgi:ATP-dependent Lon protease